MIIPKYRKRGQNTAKYFKIGLFGRFLQLNRTVFLLIDHSLNNTDLSPETLYKNLFAYEIRKGLNWQRLLTQTYDQLFAQPKQNILIRKSVISRHYPELQFFGAFAMEDIPKNTVIGYNGVHHIQFVNIIMRSG